MSGGTLRQAGLLCRAIASNSYRKNIGLSKLSPDSTLYRKVAETRGILLLLVSVPFKFYFVGVDPAYFSSSIIIDFFI